MRSSWASPRPGSPTPTAIPVGSRCPTAASPCARPSTTGSGPTRSTPGRGRARTSRPSSPRATIGANVDPALREILAWKPEPSLAERMRDAFAAGDSAAALKLHLAYKTDPRHAYTDTEVELNALGYELLRQGRREAAIAVLQLNTADHPGSSNAFDSLGEALHGGGPAGGGGAELRAGARAGPGQRECPPDAGKAAWRDPGYAGWRSSRAIRRRDNSTAATRVNTMMARESTVGTCSQWLSVILRPTKMRMRATPGLR